MKRTIWIALALALALMLACGAALADEGLTFTQQPTVGALDAENLKYPVSWTTGFKPVRVEICGTDDTEFGHYKSYDTGDYAQQSMTREFGPGYWGDSYIVRAYYQYRNTYPESYKYVDSAPFTLSTDIPALSFTAQPTVGALDAKNLKYPVSWTTGFKPVRVEICGTDDTEFGHYKSYDTGDYAQQSMTREFGPGYWGDSYIVRAYYQYRNTYPEGYKYVDSQPFSLKIHTVTFNAGGGSGVMGSVDLVVDATYILPECGFTWADHEFDRWQIGTEYYDPGDTVTITKNTTIRATWKKYYTVTFNANGGTGVIASQTVLEGTAITLPENSFVREDYNFSYWALSSYPNSRYNPGMRATINQNTTVTAVWVKKIWCTLTFDMQGYGAQIAPITVEKGTLVTEPRPTSNLKFAGWEINEGYAMDVWVPFDFSQPVTQSATLRAHWVSAAMREARLSYIKEAGTVTLTAEGIDGLMIPVGERVTINITTNPHWSLGTIRVGTLQLNTGVRVFDMPNQEIVTVGVTFVRDHDHTAETLQVYQPYTAPTCEQEGQGLIYYCADCDHYYNGSYAWLEDETAMEALVISALGHDWDAPAYVWADDYSSVTATRVCSRDAGHVETETAATTAAVTLEPGPFTHGAHTYTAVFENPAFAEQSYTLDDIEPLGIPINENTFPDANFRAYIAGRYDSDSNGYLKDDERDKMETFSCSGLNIASIAGIEYFPNLYRLILNNNPDLTEISLSGFPKLYAVQAMNCALTRVTLNNCPVLGALTLSGNPLTALETNALPKLNSLNVIGCSGLRTINISQNTRLAYLSTYGSGVYYLDIQNNPYMLEALGGTKTVGSEYVEYAGDGIYMRVNPDTEFSGQGCIPIDAEHFPDPVFRSYVANYFDLNQSGWLSEAEIADVSEIVLENASVLSSVQGIEYLTAIDSIIIGNASGLTTLDLSGNPAIQSIDIYNTGLTALNVSHLNLTYLGVTRSPLASLTLGSQPNLGILYAKGSALTELDISGCPLLIDAFLHGERTEADGAVEYSDPVTYNTLDLDAGVQVITGLERTILFDVRSGAPEPEAQTALSGEIVSEPAAPMKIGAVFTGWYIDEACAAESLFSFDTPITESLTLYAGWLVPEPVGVLKLPAALIEVDAEAFQGIAAEAVIIPATVTSINGNPFAGSAVRYVYGYVGSAAQILANSEANLIFVPIDDAWLTSH